MGHRNRRRSSGRGGSRGGAGELVGARRAQLRRADQHALGRGRAVVRGRRHDGLLQRPPRTSARRPGDPKDLYIATFDAGTGRWNTPVNMGQPVNSAPATDTDPLRLGGRPGAVDHRRRQHHLLQVGPAGDQRPAQRQRSLRHPQGRRRVDHAGAAPVSDQHRRRQRALPGDPQRRRDALLRLAAGGRLRRVGHLVLAAGRAAASGRSR